MCVGESCILLLISDIRSRFVIDEDREKVRYSINMTKYEGFVSNKLRKFEEYVRYDIWLALWINHDGFKIGERFLFEGRYCLMNVRVLGVTIDSVMNCIGLMVRIVISSL